MKLVQPIKVKINQPIVDTLKELLKQAEEGEIQVLAATIQYDNTSATSVYCPSNPDGPIDERLMIGEMQIALHDTVLSMAARDPSTFASKLLVDGDECE